MMAGGSTFGGDPRNIGDGGVWALGEGVHFARRVHGRLRSVSVGDRRMGKSRASATQWGQWLGRRRRCAKAAVWTGLTR
jgi:hypothetical protein